MHYEDEAEERVYHRLNADTIAGYLEETGSFASFFDRYEERPSQLDLIRAITHCLAIKPNSAGLPQIFRS